MVPVETSFLAGMATVIDTAEARLPAPRTGRRTTVFVVGLDPEDLTVLNRMPWALDIRGVLTPAELATDGFGELLAKARKELDAFEGEIGAITGYRPYPASALVPVLCAEHGLPSVPLEAVLKCEHRYWSRLEQREVIDELPDFGAVDLDRPEPPDGVPFPMFLKSFLPGFSVEVRDEAEFAHAARTFRSELAGERFGWEGAPIEGAACLAEGALHGVRASVEGYVHQGNVVVYGALDTVTYPGTRSVLRYQYPSQLGEDTVRRMEEIAGLVMRRIGFGNGTFGMEFFCDPASGQVCLLQIKPTHTPERAELFECVDGVTNHTIMLRLGLGEDPG
ncbi:MAG TPA: ATP-grasp domain-containing protein, partial [Amycolatopsis sp.]|nr:ATP-grasp domain-containing protein [Amycolatopsis sp.]